MNVDITKLNKVIKRTINNKKVSGGVINIESGNNELSYLKAEGNMEEDSLFAIASITKLFTTTVIFNLIENNILSFEDTLGNFFDEDILKGLHILNDKDYSHSVTIKQLISHRSGLADYSTEKPKGESSYFDEIFEKDRGITFEEILIKTKKLKPHFINGIEGKAFYSDINFDILGVILEKATNKNLEELYNEYIILPLNLSSTFLCKEDSNYSSIYRGKEKLSINNAVSCAKASGGIISNSQDLMKFLKAFFKGELFSKIYLENETWNRIQWFPIEYGVGIMRCKISRIMSPFFPAPEIRGTQDL